MEFNGMKIKTKTKTKVSRPKTKKDQDQDGATLCRMKIYAYVQRRSFYLSSVIVHVEVATPAQLLLSFYSAPKHCFASAVYATVNPSVRHTPALCQNDGTQRDVVFTIG